MAGSFMVQNIAINFPYPRLLKVNLFFFFFFFFTDFTYSDVLDFIVNIKYYIGNKFEQQ